MTSDKAAQKIGGLSESILGPDSVRYADPSPVLHLEEAAPVEMGDGGEEKPDEPDYHGHRDRLRKRFKTGGAEALHDYELLELLLFSIIPRKDTKPIAKAMIKRFGTFSEAIGAAPNLLEEIKGLGPTSVLSLKVVLAAAQKIGKDAIHERPILGSWAEVVDYCKTAMAYETIEQFRIH